MYFSIQIIISYSFLYIAIFLNKYLNHEGINIPPLNKIKTVK